MMFCTCESVAFSLLCPWPDSVCTASQTRAAMTISGKSALRKKRFKGPLEAGYQPKAWLKLGGWPDQVRVEHAHVGQVSVPLGEVEAVADHEAIRDLEADVAHGNVDLAPLRLRQERADLERRRLPRLEVPHQVRERETRVDDVLDDQDVAPGDVDVEVLQDADDAGGVGRGAVARDRHEVDLAGDRQVPHQVGHEEHGPLEHPDQQQVAAGVVGGDLIAELRDAVPQALLADQHLGDRALEGALRQSSSLIARTPGASTRPGTATTSSPRTTRGHASRSDRGILASTNTSWIFLRRPASRSPARHARTLRPGSSDSIVHRPQRTWPSSETGVDSIQSWSYSRTRTRPLPRSSRLEPAAESRSSASGGGIRRLSARRERVPPASGGRRRRSGRDSSPSRPRLVSPVQGAGGGGPAP